MQAFYLNALIYRWGKKCTEYIYIVQTYPTLRYDCIFLIKNLKTLFFNKETVFWKFCKFSDP